MYDDDSRGLECPDRPDVSPTITETRVRTDGGEHRESRSPTERTADGDPDDPQIEYYRLEMIDYQAERLLEAVVDDRAETEHDAVRHLREIGAEVECARLDLRRAPREDESDETAGDGSDDPAEPTGDVPMIVRRGPAMTAVLGPDPVAYERMCGDDRRVADDQESDREYRNRSENEDRGDRDA